MSSEKTSAPRVRMGHDGFLSMGLSSYNVTDDIAAVTSHFTKIQQSATINLTPSITLHQNQNQDPHSRLHLPACHPHPETPRQERPISPRQPWPSRWANTTHPTIRSLPSPLPRHRHLPRSPIYPCPHRRRRGANTHPPASITSGTPRMSSASSNSTNGT